jgi:hypothetical protein
MFPRSAIRCWKKVWFALGFASCLAGCQTFPPKEAASAPSLQLRKALGPEIKPIKAYGRIGWYESQLPISTFNAPMQFPLGALVLAQDGLYFWAWLEKEGRYAVAGRRIPYANVAAAYSDPLRLVVVEQCNGCAVGAISYQYFLFGLLTRSAPPQSAEQTLLALLDRTDSTHLPSAEMRDTRDRTVAVARSGWAPELELLGAGLHEGGISRRAEQGAQIGGGPGVVAGQLGGGIAALPLAIVGGAIGAAIGTVVGLGEELVAPPASEREQVHKATKELEARSKETLIQNWLHDSVMEHLLKQGTTASAAGAGHFFTRVDDLATPQAEGKEYVYLPLFREAIDHVLEVSVQKLRLRTIGSEDKQGAPHIFLELQGGYRVLSVARGRKLAGEDYECRSTAYPGAAWQAEDAKLFIEALRRCSDEISEKIATGFLARFPSATSLRVTSEGQ